MGSDLLTASKENLTKASLLQAKQALNIPHIRSRDDQHIDNAGPLLLSDNHYAFISHCQGMRDVQEDKADVFVLTPKAQLSDELIAYCLFSTIMQLHYGYQSLVEQGKGSPETGSTLTASLQVNNNIYTVNVGDSKTMLLSPGEAAPDRLAVQALNWVHRPYEEIEQKRIAASRGIIKDDYIWRQDNMNIELGLAVSRSVGDLDFDGYGIAHEPDITVLTGDHEAACLIHCCDGVTDVMNEVDIAQFFTHAGIGDDPADQLRREAYLRGSMDNITVVFVPVIDTTNLAILSYVADGHRGDAVAQYIADNFCQNFIACANNLVKSGQAFVL